MKYAGWTQILLIHCVFVFVQAYIDPCAKVPCGHYGTCSPIQNTSHFACKCSPGYHGSFCERDACQTRDHQNPCGNSGVCVIQPSDPYFNCYCPKGQFGRNCEYHICDAHPCQKGNCVRTNTMPYFSCHCFDGFFGYLCEASVSTTTSATSAFGSSSSAAAFRTCDKYRTLSDMVAGVPIENNKTTCLSGSHSSPEAFVINNCNVTTPFTSWKKGVPVMDVCRDKTFLPNYTPVGVFANGKYLDALEGGTAGIFLGCISDIGFKLGVQTCDSAPLIVHVNGTHFTMDPNVYFAII